MRVRPVIDLRSDTVTQPPPAMRRAMVEAEVGDDVYGEDSTVRRLEEHAAGLLGKEAALFVPSGTMGNLLAVLGHCERGRKAVVGDLSDLWYWEAGGAAVFGGVVYAPVATRSNGTLALDLLDAALYGEDDPQRARAAVICLEDTHGMCGGRVLPLDYLARVRELASRRGLALHLDGARVFNAAVAQGVEVRRIAELAETVCFCLSKGLAAPVGSVVAGEKGIVDRLHRLRKALGGGMRQAGFLAAAGLYALEHMVHRLAEDHEHARTLAAGLAEVDGIEVETPVPETNIVFWRPRDWPGPISELLGALEEEGVRMLEIGPGRIRAVTHLGIGRSQVERSVDLVRGVVSRVAGAGSW